MTSRYLIVQLADIGDLILSTPALAALRDAQPDAHITLLTTSHAAPVLDGTKLVNEIITFDRKQFNSSRAFFQPANLRRIFGLRTYSPHPPTPSPHVAHQVVERRKFVQRDGREGEWYNTNGIKGDKTNNYDLRGTGYDAVIFFHHFTLKLGTLKFALIALASGAKRRIGLDNGNGWFLNERLPDDGFGGKHQAQYWLDLVGLLGASSTPRPAVVATDVTAGTSLSTQQSATRTVIIHPGSGGYSLARRWDAVQFAAVADALHERHGVRIILVGGVDDGGAALKAAMRTDVVDLTGKTTLAELAGVIRAADLYIGADSGVMHLAAAVGTPVVAIFGPSNPEAWGPWTPAGMSVVVRSAPECSPCSYVGHGIGLREGCSARTCMRMVTAEQVVRAAGEILEGNFVGVGFKPAPTVHFPQRIHILGLPVDSIMYAEWLDLIEQWTSTRTGDANRVYHVCTINPEFIMIAHSDPNFRNILNRAALCVPDGVGLLWAARQLGKPLPERVTGSDGVPVIAERAAQKGWRLFFLGAAPGVADKAAQVLRQRQPTLQIVGIHSGSPAAEEEDAIVEMVNASDADILFVAYGAPEQDKWIARNLPRLDVSMAMGVGGSFDFIAGVIPRAPQWMRRSGLEWLYRLYLQPWRIRRMLRLPRFVLAVLMRKR